MSLGLASRAIVGEFYKTLATNPPMAWWSDVGWQQSSNQDAETYVMLGNVPAVRQWNGERQRASLRTDKITIYNEVYESSIEVPVEHLRRDKTGQHLARVRDLAARAGWQHWHKLLSTLVVNGGAATNGNAYDGTTFFSTTHSLGDSGTIINDLAAAQVPALNVGTATAPSESEMALAILGVINYMRRFTDDTGEPVNEDASGFLVMVPPNLAGAAESAVFNATLYNASGNPGPNPLISRGLQLKVANNPRLLLLDANLTNDFFVFRTDAGVKPFILQEELAPTMQVLEDGSEFAKLTNNCMFGVKSSRGVGYGEWMFAARAALS